MPAADASTGEQKALLIGLVLAHAGLVTEMTGVAPVLLLDEVVAHLDPGPPRRAVRRAGAARRAGLDDRRRPGAVRRHRARAQIFEVPPDAGARNPAEACADLGLNFRPRLTTRISTSKSAIFGPDSKALKIR